MIVWYILPAALLLDIVAGDPEKLPHPVRWMGKLILSAEPVFRNLKMRLTVSGLLFTICMVACAWLSAQIILTLAEWLHPYFRIALEIAIIYYCVSVRSLESAALAVYHPLKTGNTERARENVSKIVGRDVSRLSDQGIARAAVETVAENLVDGVISPLFYASIGGAPLAAAFKMINTLDSMVGYKNEKYEQFGKASAKTDDIANYIPARVSVIIIALATRILNRRGKDALKTAMQEGRCHSSPNAGFPEAAFAGALSIRLGGPSVYFGKTVDKPYIGKHFFETMPEHIPKACDLMILSAGLWTALLVLGLAFFNV